MKAIDSSRVALVALSLFCIAVAGFGLVSPEYSQLRHPVALLGAHGESHAWVFNLLAFIVPGLLLAWCALALRAGLGRMGWSARVGAQLMLLSALSFAAQGVLPLDPYDLQSAASRLHAIAWALWWVAFTPGALLLVNVSPRRWPGVAAAALVPAFALLGAEAMPAAIAQRIAWLVWFGWWIVVAPRSVGTPSRS